MKMGTTWLEQERSDCHDLEQYAVLKSSRFAPVLIPTPILIRGGESEIHDLLCQTSIVAE